MDRRTFLKRGILGGALLALGGTGLAVFPGKEVGPTTQPLLVFGPKEFQTLAAIAARIVTADGRDPIAIAHGVDKLLVGAAQQARSDLNKLLGLFDNALGALVLDGRLLPFTRLGDEAQDAAITKWRDSRLAVRRTGYQALRKLCLAAYYAEESSWGPLRYEPPAGLNVMAYDDSRAGTPEWLRQHTTGGT